MAVTNELTVVYSTAPATKESLPGVSSLLFTPTQQVMVLNFIDIRYRHLMLNLFLLGMIFLFFRTPLLELLNHPFMSPLLILSLDQLKVSFLLRFVPLLAYSPLTAYAGYRLRLPGKLSFSFCFEARNKSNYMRLRNLQLKMICHQ